MPPVGFESTISAGERPRTSALDRVATGTGFFHHLGLKYVLEKLLFYFTNHSKTLNTPYEQNPKHALWTKP